MLKQMTNIQLDQLTHAETVRKLLYDARTTSLIPLVSYDTQTHQDDQITECLSD